jgi:hypothetical protein
MYIFRHRPFTCFFWHFQNQRRRRPYRRADGTFSYDPDFYCNDYDEQSGVCPNGDEYVQTLDFIFTFFISLFLVANYYIEMPMIRKNVIIYVTIKPVYVHMNRMLKDIVLKMVLIVHTLMVQTIFDNRYLIVEKCKTVI